MNAPEDQIRQDRPSRGPCLVDGCPCKDPRIISFRRAAFYASRAQASGETADRIVPVDPDWRIPTYVDGPTA
jgi:hypothetical protein